MGGGIIEKYTIETFELTKTFPVQGGLGDFLRRRPKEEEDGVTPVDGVNMKVRAGEAFGILGPNGAGKTTLIKMLCTLILPTSGEAFVNGYDVVKESGKVKESIGFVTTDERSFYWRLTARQNLEFFASLHNFYSKEAHDMVDELLEVVNLKRHADERFLTYSAGMKQRMAIARGLLNDPEVLFMDEPTRSLDPGAAQDLRDFIKRHIVKERGKTIFISTHNLEEAEELCDRIAIFDDGKINVVGRPTDLKAALGDGSKLSDVFLHYTGKRFEERREGGSGSGGGSAGSSSRRHRLDGRRFGHGGGFGMRKRGL